MDASGAAQQAEQPLDGPDRQQQHNNHALETHSLEEDTKPQGTASPPLPPPPPEEVEEEDPLLVAQREQEERENALAEASTIQSYDDANMRVRQHIVLN